MTVRRYFVDKAAEKDPREDKLPKWAQEKLTTLRAAATEAAELLNALRLGASPGPFWMRHWDPQQADRRFFLPPGAGTLTWGDPADKKMDGRLEFRPDPDGNGLIVSTCHGGSQTPAIEPISGNQFRVRCNEERR